MLDLTILNKNIETPEIFSFELGFKGGKDLPEFEAGSHIDVHINDQITRQYSLFNDPVNRKTYKIAVLKDPNSRGGSVAVHETFKVGDTLQVSSPRNLFPLNTDCKRVLLFAGGIGITPLISMAKVLHRLGCDFELHYHTRSKASTAFIDELVQSAYSANIFFHFSDEENDKSVAIKKALANPSDDVHLYTCGPNGYMDYVFDTARSLSWHDNNLHKEVFSAAPVELDETDKSFELKLVSSGMSLHVPHDKTALEVLEEAGIDIDFSCEQGVCGSCLTKVSSGTPEHRDQFQTESEKSLNDHFTPCCSRAKTESLSIDL